MGSLGIASGLALAGLVGSAPLWRWLAPKLLVLASFVLGVCLCPVPEHPPLPAAGTARLVADVEEVRYGQGEDASARVLVRSGTRLADGAPIPAGTRLWLRPFPVPDGARLQLLAAVKPAMPFRNQTPHPPLPTAHVTRGSAVLPSPAAFAVLSQPLHARWLDGARRFTRARLAASLPDDVAAVARALLLGDPDALDDEADDDVRGAGLSHVFAVSGMHVALLAGLCVLGLRQLLLRVPRCAASWNVPRVAAGMGIPLALAIAAFTGGAPSAWRASITTAISWFVVACGRNPSAPAVTALACLVFGALTPSDALRPAFLLSIAATAAIIGPRPGGPSGFGASARDVLVLTLRSSLATAPIVWWGFGGLPPLGLLANLLLVPVGSLLLLLTAAHAAFACAAPLFAPLSAAPLAITARAFMRGCAALNRQGPHPTLPVLSLEQGLLLSACVCVVLFARSRRLQLWAAALGVLACAGLEWRLRHVEKPEGELRISFFDVGQGDAALLDLPDGRALLIDAGGNPQHGPDPGERVLLPLLAARRRDRVDTVVLTHPHPDHFGGLDALLPRVPVRELWDSGQGTAEAEMSGTSQHASDIVHAARARGTRVMTPPELCGHPRAFGAARVSVLWPCPSYDAGFDPNDNSLVLRVEFAGRRVLFTGDIEAHAEAALLASGSDLRADVLKVPHHGSRTSSSEALLAAVQPSLAIISAGAVNPFGHPHPDVVERLKAHAKEVIDLGQRGGTQLTIDARGQIAVATTQSSSQ